MRNIVRLGLILAVTTCVAACGASGSTRSTFDGPEYSGPAFNKVLVIGVADSFNSRATFERSLAQELSGNGTTATAYYTLVDGQSAIEREAIEKLVDERGFDAVLITRVLNRDVTGSVKEGSSSAKKTRRDGGVAELFRYDYEELNEPAELSLELSVIISSEVFSAATKDRVWAIESDISDSSSVGVLVLDAVEIVSRELRRDGLVN